MISWSFTRFPSSADRLLCCCFFRCTLTWPTSCAFTACASLHSLLTQFSNTIEIIQPKYPNIPWVNKLCKAAAFFVCLWPFDKHILDWIWFYVKKKKHFVNLLFQNRTFWAFRCKGPINCGFCPSQLVAVNNYWSYNWSVLVYSNV